MNCPKCGSKNQKQNFCGNCGAALWEKCPECGEMELIGRRVCEKKYRYASNIQRTFANSYANKKLSVIMGWILCYIAGSLWIFSSYLVAKIEFPINEFAIALILLLATIPISLLVITSINRKLRAMDEGKREFLKQHPDYAEILKKVEEGEKNENKD